MAIILIHPVMWDYEKWYLGSKWPYSYSEYSLKIKPRVPPLSDEQQEAQGLERPRFKSTLSLCNTECKSLKLRDAIDRRVIY